MRVMALLLAFWAMAPMAAQAVPPPAPLAEAPYRVDYNGWFTVPVMVNGKGPYDFIVDTGATKTLAFRNLADAQQFEPTGGPPQFVFGLGSAGDYPAYFMGKVSIGEVTLPSLTTVVLPDWEGIRSPAGVIGLDLLSHYVVVFDATKKTMALYPADSAPKIAERWPSAKLIKTDFGLNAGDLYTVRARLDFRPVTFLVDLGASGTVINRTAHGFIMSDRVSITVGPSRESPRITDALNKTNVVDAILINRFDLYGKIVFYRRVLAVEDAKIFSDVGYGAKPFGLFGADLLRDRSFAFDFGSERLFVGPRLKRSN